MTEDDFFKKIKMQMESARNLKEGNAGFNIKRGMAHVMSGYAEDLFAVYMAEKFNRKEFQFLVDKVISYERPSDKRVKSFKPDLFVSNHNIMTHYFDLKTNLGYNREMHKDYLDKKNDFIKSLRGQSAWIKFAENDENPESVQQIRISEKIKYQIVVIWGWNINKNDLQKNIDIAEKLDCIELYVLAENLDNINMDDFHRLHKDSMELIQN